MTAIELYVLKVLTNYQDITNKYNIFYNGSNIIAVYKDSARLYKDNVDTVLKFSIIKSNKLSYYEIFNSENYNFIIMFKYDIRNTDNLHNNKLYILSRDLIIQDIKDGKIVKPDKDFILNNEYLEYNATRKITL